MKRLTDGSPIAVDTVLDALARPLHLWRRHRPGCKYASNGQSRKCKCPIYVRGTHDGQQHYRSLNLRDWDEAAAELQKIMGRDVQSFQPRVEVVKAADDWLKELEESRLKKSSLKKWRPVLAAIKLVSRTRRLVYVDEWDNDAAKALRSVWRDNTEITAYKKEEYARHFFKMMIERGHVKRSPYKGLTSIQQGKREVMPFSDAEMAAIINECHKPDSAHEPSGTQARRRALIYLMRWSGLRIADAWNLLKGQVTANEDGSATVSLNTKKTGSRVTVTIPPDAFGYICEVVAPNSIYWFHAEDATKGTSSLQRTLQTLFRRAGLPTTREQRKEGQHTAHAHRFRHTFACDLLSHGTDIGLVSRLLGHSSARITEKHYEHWIKGRQDRLDEQVRRTWNGNKRDEHKGLSEEETRMLAVFRKMKQGA